MKARLEVVELTLCVATEHGRFAMANVVPVHKTDGYEATGGDAEAFAAELAARWNLFPELLAALEAVRQDLETDYMANPSVRAGQRRQKHLDTIRLLLERASQEVSK